MSGSTVAALLSVAEYREQRARLFPSEGSMQWYLRQHRAALIEGGALLLIAGRYHVDPDKFDAYVLSKGAKDAAARPGVRNG